MASWQTRVSLTDSTETTYWIVKRDINEPLLGNKVRVAGRPQPLKNFLVPADKVPGLPMKFDAVTFYIFDSRVPKTEFEGTVLTHRTPFGTWFNRLRL